MSLPSEWTTFLSLIVDLLNECESRMSGQDYRHYRVLENLLERLHSVRNGCKRVANSLVFTAENAAELETTTSKIRILSESLQGVSDCLETTARCQSCTSRVSAIMALFVDKNCLYPGDSLTMVPWYFIVNHGWPWLTVVQPWCATMVHFGHWPWFTVNHGQKTLLLILKELVLIRAPEVFLNY